jgi:hypothetical protein
VVHTVVLFLALAVAAGAAAIQPALDRVAIEEAVAIGHSRIEAVRTRFHQPYRLQVRRPPVDFIDIVTPFRRVEIEAEWRARSGNRSLSQRDALAILEVAGGSLDVFVEFTFHPLNTYIGVPAYEVLLAAPGRAQDSPLPPRELQRIPRYGARVEGFSLPYPLAPPLPGGSQPMLGGTVVAKFDLRRLDPNGAYEVVVTEAGKELARARTDLRALR